MIQEDKFVQCFDEFGNTCVLSEELKAALEQFVCTLFSSKKYQSMRCDWKCLQRSVLFRTK